MVNATALDAPDVVGPRVSLDRVQLLVCGLLLGIATAVAFAYPLTSRALTVQVLQYALVAYASVRAGLCVRPDRPRLAMLVFWLFVYTIFGIVQIVQLHTHLNPFRVAAPDGLVIQQLIILWLGCVAADVTSSIVDRGTTPPSLLAGRPPRVVSLRRVVVLGALTLLLTPYFIELFGGLGTLFSSRQEVTSQLVRNQGGSIGGLGAIPAVLARVMPFVALLGLVLLRVAKQFRFRDRVELAALLAGLLLVNLVISNPLTSARYWLATMLTAFFLVGDWIKKPRWQAAFVGGFLIASLVVFPFLDRYRFEVAQDRENSPVYHYTNKTDYGSPQDVINGLYYVGQQGHSNGRQAAGALLFFVPRSIWTDKPTNTAELLADSIGFPNPNIDTPLWAEGYVDFGIPGTVVFLALFGAVAGIGDRQFGRDGPRARTAALLLPALAGYELIVLRGSLLQAMGHLSMIVLVGLMITRRGSPADGPASAPRDRPAQLVHE